MKELELLSRIGVVPAGGHESYKHERRVVSLTGSLNDAGSGGEVVSEVGSVARRKPDVVAGRTSDNIMLACSL